MFLEKLAVGQFGQAVEVCHTMKPLLTFDQALGREAGLKHITDPMAQKPGIDRFSQEIGRTRFKGMVDGLQVFQPGHHEYGYVLAIRQQPKFCAGIKAVHSPWHHDIQ